MMTSSGSGNTDPLPGLNLAMRFLEGREVIRTLVPQCAAGYDNTNMIQFKYKVIEKDRLSRLGVAFDMLKESSESRGIRWYVQGPYNVTLGGPAVVLSDLITQNMLYHGAKIGKLHDTHLSFSFPFSAQGDEHVRAVQLCEYMLVNAATRGPLEYINSDVWKGELQGIQGYHKSGGYIDGSY